MTTFINLTRVQPGFSRNVLVDIIASFSKQLAKHSKTGFRARKHIYVHVASKNAHVRLTAATDPGFWYSAFQYINSAILDDTFSSLRLLKNKHLKNINKETYGLLAVWPADDGTQILEV